MRRKFSIYHFLVALMMFTLILPAFAGASSVNGGNNEEGQERTTGSLTIHKFEQEPGSEQGVGDGTELETAPDGKPLKGVTYTIKQTHELTIDSNGNEVWSEVTNGQTYTVTTDDDGKALLSELPLGRYKVTEVSGPEHVNVNTDPFSVDIPMTSKDGSSVNYDVHVYPKNEIIRGGVKLTKTDGDSNALLSGVKFELYNEDGKRAVDKDGNTLPEFTTENGVIKVDNLAYGKYYFKEVATIEGYLLGGQTETFSVKKSDVTVEIDVKNYKHPEVIKEVDKDAVNRGEIVTYTIKVDLPGDIGSYNNFVVTDVLDENLIYVPESANSPTGFTPNYDSNTHTLTWTANTSQLEKGEVTFTFEAKVSEEAEANKVINNKAYIDYENQHGNGGEKDSNDVPVTPTAGSLTVIKQDGNNNEEKLSGAEFVLKDAAGEVVATGTSGENGVVDFEGATAELDYGNYTLHETKAPNGYRLLTKPINVTINENNSEVTITVDNYKSGWELPKTGGIGTMLFTFIGLSLMGTASYMYTRRRKGESV